ncbi:MAG: hypothetical protein ACREQ5_05070 [Candidatus Dormibacteria bacterium]
MTLSIQIIQEGPRNAIVKLTGNLSTANLPLTTAVDVTTLNQGGTGPTPTSVRIDHIDYSISDQLEVQLQWHATTNLDLLPLAGRGRMSFWNFGGLQNNAGAGKNGNIDILTSGWASGTQVFSIVLELVKQGSS